MKKPLNPKLAILQKADGQRKWYSLDDHRVCILCNKVITGRQIEIRVDAQERYELRCPTDGCAATARDWFYPEGPMLLRQDLDSRQKEREIDLGRLFGDTSET